MPASVESMRGSRGKAALSQENSTQVTKNRERPQRLSTEPFQTRHTQSFALAAFQKSTFV